MDRNRPKSAVPIFAHLADIEVVGDLEKKISTTRPDHYVLVYLDGKEVLKSEKKPRVPSPQWKWQEDRRFQFHPSSKIRIVIYRESRTRIARHLVGQFVGKVIEILESKATIDLKDKYGSGIASKIKINLSLVSEPEEELIETVIASAARLDSTIQAPTGISVLGTTLQLTKNIMDVAGTHPILKASWTVISAVYKAVQEATILDDSVQDLAENLREMLSVVKECPDLLVIAGTTDVIEKIGRTSLKIASLIHEYMRPSFARRIMKSQLSDNMKSRIAQSLKSCDDLKQKVNKRIGVDTNRTMKKTKDDMDKSQTNIENTLKTVKDDKLFKEIQEWLSAPDSSGNYNDAHDRREKNTCSWFIEGSRFREFQEKADFLWIKGTAGCGKTVLCSAVIDKIIELQKKDTSVNFAYFFFDGRDSQTELQLHDKLIRSLIWQLSLQCDGIPAALVKLYGRGWHQQHSTSSLEDTLHHIIDDLHSTYIVIDSIDECTDRVKTLRWIEQIISHHMGNLRIVVASRPERDINDALQLLDPHSIDMINESANHDIKTYLEQQLSLVNNWDPETQAIVQSTLTERAQGMFRWVALQLMELQRCPNRQSVMIQLDNLPTGLYETYDRILSKIDNPTDRTDAKTFLRWLCFSVCPMNLAEIAETIVVDFDTQTEPQYTPEHRYWDEQDVMEKCAGLIAESDAGNVKLAHFSIKEYLLSEQLRIGATSWFHLTSDELSHSLIAQACLACLLHLDKPDLVNNDIAASFPLAPYAAQYWIFHARSGGIDEPEPSFTSTLAKNLFGHEEGAWLNWVRIWDLDRPFLSMEARELQRSNIGPPLYYAALAGLEQVSQQLIVNGDDVNVQGGNYNNALQAASHRGHDGIVKLLLENGADANVQGGSYGNVLQVASYHGHEGIVKLLLENSARVNVEGGSYGSALQAASQYGHERTVKLLLENGADTNVQGGFYGNALQAASHRGHREIGKLLLENGADVKAQGGNYGNAIQAASDGGHEGIVKLLLENGADVTVQGDDDGVDNALYAAAAGGHESIVKLLLENGADVNEQGGIYSVSNALYTASAGGYEGIVKLLLENGADVDAQGSNDGNALQVASGAGHEGIVKLLLENGADVNMLGGMYYVINALYAASAGGHEGIVKVLLENGADVNVQGGEYGNALQAAIVRRHEEVVQLLLENGADVNIQGGFYSNALEAASAEGHEKIVKLLLGNGVDITIQGGAALQAASRRGHEGIVKLLLENGADVNIQGGDDGSALYRASFKGHEKIANLLLKNGADVNMQGGVYGNPLQAASTDGHERMVKLLLENGADINMQGGFYGNALQAASGAGYEGIVKLLMENGADVNMLGGEYGNALQTASVGGHEGIVKLLLENGADVNMQGGEYGNALQAASARRREGVVKLLLENGADVNMQGGEYANALYAASAGGSKEIVKLLLQNGADVNAWGGEYANALCAASAGRHAEIVKLLRENGAENRTSS